MVDSGHNREGSIEGDINLEGTASMVIEFGYFACKLRVVTFKLKLPG